MKIGITGGSGGVGSAIIEMALRRGDVLVSVDRVPPKETTDGVTHITADVADYDALVGAFTSCDAVVHMAAIPSPFRHPDHVVHNNNVVGSYNVMRAAIECGVKRICQASSVNAVVPWASSFERRRTSGGAWPANCMIQLRRCSYPSGTTCPA